MNIERFHGRFCDVRTFIDTWEESGFNKDLDWTFFAHVVGFMETYVLKETSVPLMDLVIAVGLAQSKREAREFISGNSVSLNNVKVADLKHVVEKDKCVSGQWLMLGKGKSARRLVWFR